MSRKRSGPRRWKALFSTPCQLRYPCTPPHSEAMSPIWANNASASGPPSTASASRCSIASTDNRPSSGSTGQRSGA